ncbi:galectin-3-like [Melanerpes formicivorus]|uniref:galectin-3-like n=1 Tax=Melanerpes formicivorus TaxID=211600 RepID=UPI00358F31AA
MSPPLSLLPVGYPVTLHPRRTAAATGPDEPYPRPGERPRGAFPGPSAVAVTRVPPAGTAAPPHAGGPGPTRDGGVGPGTPRGSGGSEPGDGGSGLRWRCQIRFPVSFLATAQ